LSLLELLDEIGKQVDAEELVGLKTVDEFLALSGMA
jgi:hypothetical protein